MAPLQEVGYGSFYRSKRTPTDEVDAQSHRLIAAESQRFDGDTVAHPCRFFGFFFFWTIAEGVLEHARGNSIIQKTEKFLLF